MRCELFLRDNMDILGRMEHEEMVGYSQYGELKGSGGGVKISQTSSSLSPACCCENPNDDGFCGRKNTGLL